MAMVGVLARVDAAARESVIGRLEQISGVTTFGVEDRNRLGVLIERSSIEDAHKVLTVQISGVSGILGAWPIFSDVDSAEQAGSD